MNDEMVVVPEKRGPGRPRGSLNNRARALARKYGDDEKYSPVAVMIRCMTEFLADAEKIKLEGFPDTKKGRQDLAAAHRERRNILSLAIGAAKDAAPYVHSRLQTVMIEGSEDGPPILHAHVVMTKEEMIADLMARGLPLPDIED